jgi:hypothetical protein
MINESLLLCFLRYYLCFGMGRSVGSMGTLVELNSETAEEEPESAVSVGKKTAENYS